MCQGGGSRFLFRGGTFVCVEMQPADTMPELCTFVDLMALCVKNIIQLVLIFNWGWIMYNAGSPHYTHALLFSELIVSGGQSSFLIYDSAVGPAVVGCELCYSLSTSAVWLRTCFVFFNTISAPKYGSVWALHDWWFFAPSWFWSIAFT